MSNGIKPTILKGILLCGLCLFMAGYVFPYISWNGTGTVYNGSDEGDNRESIYCSSEISKYIEEGGGHFLRTISNIMNFSELIELSNIEGDNYTRKRELLDEALSNISKAIHSYDTLIELAESTPYDWRVIYRLWFFDYDGFCSYYELNPLIFREIKVYLALGDVTGSYRYCRSRFYQIESLLLKIKANLYILNSETLKDIWKLNELCTKTLTAGQYVARVFYSLEQNRF